MDSVLVKYVIFEKISSDPRKYRCKVRLAIHNGHHRDPVLDVYFDDFLETYDTPLGTDHFECRNIPALDLGDHNFVGTTTVYPESPIYLVKQLHNKNRPVKHP